MADLQDFEAALPRVQVLAARIGTRARWVGFGVGIAAVAAWALLLRRWVFDSAGAFLGWLPVLVFLLVPGLILTGFGKRMLRLGPAISRIADEPGVVVGAIRDEAESRLVALRQRGLRSLLEALRQIRRHGDEVRGLVAEAAGTARVFALPYLGAVALASAAAVVVGLLCVIGLISLAF